MTYCTHVLFLPAPILLFLPVHAVSEWQESGRVSQKEWEDCQPVHGQECADPTPRRATQPLHVLP